MPTEMHKELELNLKILLQVNKRLFRPPHVIEHVANVSIALGDVQGVLAGNLDLDIQGLLIVLQRWLVLTLAVVNNPDVAVALGHIRESWPHRQILVSRIVDFTGLVVVAW